MSRERGLREATSGVGHPRRGVLCDDHAVFGAGLVTVVRTVFPSAEVELLYSLAALLSRVESATEDELFVVDVALGDGTIEMALPQLAAMTCPVLVVSGQECPDVARRILASGIAGYVAKSASLDELRSAIVAVASGGRHIPELVLGATQSTQPAARSDCRLTARQGEVAELLASGYSNREIREELGVSENTVKSHLRGIFAALDVSNRTEAAIEWLRIRSEVRNN